MVLSQKQKDHRREYYKTYYTAEVAEHKRKYREQHKARYLRNYALKNWRKAKKVYNWVKDSPSTTV